MPLIPLDEKDKVPEGQEKRTDLSHKIAHATGVSHNCFKETPKDGKKEDQAPRPSSLSYRQDDPNNSLGTVLKDDDKAIKKDPKNSSQVVESPKKDDGSFDKKP